MFRRDDPLTAIDAQLHDLAEALAACPDPDSADALKLLWRADLLLDRRSEVMSRVAR